MAMVVFSKRLKLGVHQGNKCLTTSEPFVNDHQSCFLSQLDNPLLEDILSTRISSRSLERINNDPQKVRKKGHKEEKHTHAP